jgi:hypothetical protein
VPSNRPRARYRARPRFAAAGWIPGFCWRRSKSDNDDHEHDSGKPGFVGLELVLDAFSRGQ